MGNIRRNRAEEILFILRSEEKREEILSSLEDYHSNDIAHAIELLSAEERDRVYGLLDNERLSDVLSYLEEASEYVGEIPIERAADIVDLMDIDDAVELLDSLDDETQRELIELVDEETRSEIEMISSYDDDEFGSVMTTNFVVISKKSSVKSAMRELIAQSAENDNISTIYVVDENDVFYGAIDLKALIIARQDIALEDIIVTSYPFVYDYDRISDRVEELRSYSEDSVPVLSIADNRIIGVITAQDIVDMIDTEISEDYARLAGLVTEDDMEEPILASMKKRIPWLTVLLFLGLAVSAVVGIFEGIVKELAVIVCFQSLILGMAGNAGTQSLAVTIRVLSGDSGERRGGRLLFKELRVALFNGLLLGAFSLVFIGLYLYLLKSQSLGFSFAASACVGLALCISMFIAGIMGAVVPMLFDKMKIDPAVASGPLITTVNDLVAVVTYYGLAWLLLIKI